MGAATGLLPADADVAASREICIGAGQRAAETERVDDRRACLGLSNAGPDAAAAEPGIVGCAVGDERGPAVRGGRVWRPQRGGAWRRGLLVIAAIDETGQEKRGESDGGCETPVHGLRGPGRERD